MQGESKLNIYHYLMSLYSDWFPVIKSFIGKVRSSKTAVNEKLFSYQSLGNYCKQTALMIARVNQVNPLIINGSMTTQK